MTVIGRAAVFMKTILLIDLTNDSLVAGLLSERDINVINFSDIEQEGAIWPNLIKRCACVLVSGLTGLVDDNPQLESLLGSLVSMGIKVQVLCQDLPIADINNALIGGIHYQFGVDVNSREHVSLALEPVLENEPSEQFTA